MSESGGSYLAPFFFFFYVPHLEKPVVMQYNIKLADQY